MNRFAVRLVPALLLVTLAGCTGAGDKAGDIPTTRLLQPRTAQIGYVSPDGPLPGPISFRVRGKKAQAVDRIAAAMREAGLTVETADQSQGLVVGSYAGDPAEFLDCGFMFLFPVDNDSEPIRIAGNAERATLDLGTPAEPIPTERELHLDARLTVHLFAEGRDLEVAGSADYVVTKAITRQGGQPTRDTISFNSGAEARFPHDALCRSDGDLEHLVAVSLAHPGR